MGLFKRKNKEEKRKVEPFRFCTGVKDKTGRQIYDDDIIEVEYDLVLDVYTRRAIYHVVYLEKEKSWFLEKFDYVKFGEPMGVVDLIKIDPLELMQAKDRIVVLDVKENLEVENYSSHKPLMYNCFKRTLYPPKDFIPYNCDRTQYKTEIRVDECLADEIEELWKQGIRTMGCCCGHGRHLGMIQVLPEDTGKMVELGYEFYIYPEEGMDGAARTDAFVPKSYGHKYHGYTDSYLG